MTCTPRFVAFVLVPALTFALAAQAGSPPAAPAAPAKATATPAQPAAPAAPAKAATVPAKATAVPATPSTAANTTPVPATAAATTLDAVIAGPWRKPKNVARDIYRHPKQTLTFFGVTPGQALIEITPGGGWYAEILAPLLNGNGSYTAAVIRPSRSTGEAARDDQSLKSEFAADSAHYGHAKIVEFDAKAPNLGAPGSVDTVLTFRNVHNWVMGGTQAAMFKAFFDVLKPGGVLGVVDHRAKSGPATDGKQGYLTEQQVIDYATAAGFVLDAKSEINANPKDTKDYPHGVWTLPPTLSQGNHGIGTYTSIGESDRMTLRFVKPGAGAKK